MRDDGGCRQTAAKSAGERSLASPESVRWSGPENSRAFTAAKMSGVSDGLRARASSRRWTGESLAGSPRLLSKSLSMTRVPPLFPPECTYYVHMYTRTYTCMSLHLRALAGFRVNLQNGHDFLAYS